MAILTPVGMNSDGQFCIATPTDTLAGFAPVAYSDDYNDLINKPSSPSVRTSSGITLSLVGTGATGTQISATNDSTARCWVSTSTTATISSGSTSNVVMKKCATNSSTEANWTTGPSIENSQTISLAVVLQSVQGIKGELSMDIPAGWFVKLVNSGSGTHTELFIGGEKTIYS